MLFGSIYYTFGVYAQSSALINNLNDPQLLLDFREKIVVAFVIAFFTVLSVTLAVNKWIKEKQFLNSPNRKFWHIILDSNCYPSLSLFQFTMWTFVISFAYLGIYLTRILNGQLELAPLDGNMMILLGLSVSAPIINKVISNVKYSNAGCENTIPKYSSMLEENDKFSLTRFQFFLWTWVSIVIFFGILSYDLATLSVDNIKELRLPEINDTLIVLMGISQAGYLGAKAVTKINPTITKFLRNFNSVKNKEVWTILGNGLGNEYGKAIVNTTEFDQEQILRWNDKVIEIIPESSLVSALQKAKDDPILLRLIIGARVIESKFETKDGTYIKTN